MTSTRTPEKIFESIASALRTEDVEAFVSNYADDATLIVQGTVSRGQPGARQLITQLRRDLPHASWELGSVVADNVLYMTWRAQSTTGNANGTDTFVFHDGKIRVQTVVVTTGSSS